MRLFSTLAMLISCTLYSFLSLDSLAAAAPSNVPHSTLANTAKLSIHTVWQFPNNTWVENVAVRSNGQLLVTLITTPEVWQVDPFGIRPARLVYSFPGAIGLLGISEVKHDKFVVVVGGDNPNSTFTPVLPFLPNTFSVWEIDAQALRARKIVDMPEAQFLNGLATLDTTNGLVLVSDSGAGVVYLVDTGSGKYKVVLDDPTMKIYPDGLVGLGINGIQLRNSTLYYTNSNQGTFSRIPIHLKDGSAAGPARVLAHAGAVLDDFVLDRAGTAFVTTDPGNTVLKIAPTGDTAIAVGSVNSTVVYGPTSAQYGRTPVDSSMLYVVTNGGLASPIFGIGVEGGSVVAVGGLV